MHAPRALLDGRGRRIMFANLNEWRPPDELVASGWSGCMSLPVALTLDPDGRRVRFVPVDELQALRHEPSERVDLALAAGAGRGAGAAETEVVLPEASGDGLEIELEIEAGSAAAAPRKPPSRSTLPSARSRSSSARRACVTILRSHGGTHGWSARCRVRRSRSTPRSR